MGLWLLTVLPVHPALAAEPLLPPVVVTATRTEKTLDDTPIRTEVVGREEIARTHARTLKEALENIPGLQLREVHGKSGYEVSLQGLTSDQVLVLIDGLPITPSTGSTVDLSQYLLAEVDHIEVVKGAASAQYGSAAMGGVINVITRRIEPGLAGAATADVGSYGDQNVSGQRGTPAKKHAQFRVEGGGQAWRLRVTGDALDDAGFATDPGGWSQQGDAIERQQVAARLAWTPSRRTELWTEAGTYRENDEQRYQYYAPPQQVPQRKTEDITRDRFTGGGSWQLDGGVRTQLKGVSERYESRSREYSSDIRVAEREVAMRMDHVTAQVDLPAWNRQLWQFGADLHRETLVQSVDGRSELGMQGSAERASRELFVQNDILFDDTWELLLGVRWQDDSDFGGHVAPKASLKARLLDTPDWRAVLRASYGQGYRVPNLKERHFLFDHSSLGYIVIGNPDLQPESSDSFQLGATLGLRDTLSLDVNLYANRVRDLIQIDEDNGTPVNGVVAYTYENVGRARTRGVETALSWQATPALALNAAYTLTDTEDLDTGSELTRRPRTMARLGLDWQPTPATLFSMRARHQSDELVGSASGGRSPAWSVLDLTLNQNVGRAWVAFVGINNVFDRQRDFSDPDDFGPLAGRFVYLGLRYAFDRGSP